MCATTAFVEGIVELLRRADAAPALPRLGGMARPNGVVIVSEHHWAFAGVDGSLVEGRMPSPPEVHCGLISTTSQATPVRFSAIAKVMPAMPPPTMRTLRTEGIAR